MKTFLKINPQYNHLQSYLSEMPATFADSGETIFRGRNEIKRMLAPDGTELVVKHFARLPLFRRLIYSTVSRSKARRAFDFGNRFISLGFNTPTPVACVEISSKGILTDAYFVCLHSDFTPLFEPLVNADRFDTALADNVAALMNNLHRSGAIHGDPNLNNILYKVSDDGSVAMTLIDTNRSHFGRKLSTRRRLKNLMRVSHRRDLMQRIVGRYAELSGLDPAKTIDKVFKMLEHFERNRRIRHRLKSVLLRRSSD